MFGEIEERALWFSVYVYTKALAYKYAVITGIPLFLRALRTDK